MFMWSVTLCLTDRCIVNDVRHRVLAKRPVSHRSPLPTLQEQRPTTLYLAGCSPSFQVHRLSFFCLSLCLLARFRCFFDYFLTIFFCFSVLFLTPDSPPRPPFFLRILSSSRPRVHRRLFFWVCFVSKFFLYFITK